MKKRFLASLLALVMVVGLLPTTALAAGAEMLANSLSSGASTLADNDQYYDVTFVKDAFEMTTIEVRIVDGGDDDMKLNLTEESKNKVTLEGAVFYIGDGEMSVLGLVTGYGLTSVDANMVGTDMTYYFQQASWGSLSSGQRVFETFTYEDVVNAKNSSRRLVLNYRAGGNMPIDVNAVLEQTPGNTGSRVEIPNAAQTIAPGVLTNDVAQRVVRNSHMDGVSAYFFDHAEVRHTDGTAYPIDSVWLLGNYYYVTGEAMTGQVSFDRDNWSIYLVYTQAYTLTITASSQGGSNFIDNTQITTAGREITYQIPRNGSLEVDFRWGQYATIDIQETTANHAKELFSSAEDGYQIKSTTLSFDGATAQYDRQITVDFTSRGSTSAFTLDYTHYIDNAGNPSGSYHGAEVKLGNDVWETADAGSAVLRNSMGENARTITITKTRDSNSYVVDTIVINGTALNLPTGWSWQSTANSTWTGRAETDILDSNNQVMAHAVVNFRLEYGEQRNIYISTTTITFSNICNDLKIDRINLTNQGYPGMTVTVVGDALDATYDRTISGSPINNADLVVGAGIYPGQQPTIKVTVPFGHYVTGFPVFDTNGDQVGSLEPNNDTSGNWWGDKVYPILNYSDSATPQWPGQRNGKLLNDAHNSTGALNSDLIWFQFRYDLDGSADTPGFSSDGVDFHLGVDNADTPALAEFTGAVPAGKVFAGWSLTPNNTTGTGIYQPGQIIPRTVVMNNADVSVAYVSYRAGYAYINLYPVFMDAADSPYTDYTVFIHMGSTTTTYSFNGGVVGAYLDRDFVLALERVASLVDDNPTYILDGARSDTFKILSRSGNNTFDLYFNNTESVTLTFESAHGFTNYTGNSTTAQAQPGTAMRDIQNLPEPQEEGVGASFVGWSTANAQDILGATPLDNAIVPYENTTYYAVYAEDITLTFHPWSPEGGWEQQGTSITVEAGTSITDMGGNLATTVTDLAPGINGYTFSGWAQGGPYSSEPTPLDDLLAKDDFSGNTFFYAIYEAESNATIILDPNGGTFPEGTVNLSDGKVTLANQTVGAVLSGASLPTPTRNDSHVFVGWVKSDDSTSPTGSMAITVEPGSNTYKALWLPVRLDVTVYDEDLVYDGTAQEPNLNVSYNGTSLQKGNGANQYQAVYASNTNAGIATVTVTAMVDGVQLSGFATFNIAKQDINNAVINGIEDSYEYTGSAHRPNVTVTDNDLGIENKQLEAGRDYTVSYGVNTNVSDRGSVTILGQGNFTGAVTRQFSITAYTGEIAVIPIPDQIYNNGNQPEGLQDYTLVVYDVTNQRILNGTTDYTATWPTSWGLGPQTVRVEGKGNYVGCDTTATFNIVAQAMDLTVEVTPIQAPVGGTNPTVTVTAGGERLEQTTDYTMVWKKYNDQTSTWNNSSESEMQSTPGMYQVQVTGAGAYTGATGSGIFVRTAVDAGDLTVSSAQDVVLIYDGKDHSGLLADSNLTVRSGENTVDANNWSITSVLHNGTLLTADGSGSYADQLVNAGTYIVNVEASGTYSGTGVLTIYITPKHISTVTFSPDLEAGDNGDPYVDNQFQKYYNGAAHDHPFTLTDTDINADTPLTMYRQDAEGVLEYDDGTDYVVQYHEHSTHIDAGQYTMVIQGVNNYMGTRSETFTILPKPINVTENITLTYGYSQEEANTQLETLRQGILDQIIDADESNVTLTMWVDQILAASETGHDHLHVELAGTKAGNYQLNVTGKVIVEQANLEDATVTVSPDSHAFNGNAHTPGITVTFPGFGTTLTLSPTQDYTVEYIYHGENGTLDENDETVAELKEVGVYTIVIRARENGNYTGENRTATFEVTAPAAGSFQLGTIPSVEYTGQEHTPDVDVFFEGSKLVKDQDYTLSYTGNKDVGTATVTVTGKDSYAALNAITTFQITPKSLTSGMVTVEPDSETYTGSPITPTVTVKDTVNSAEVTLTPGVDYTVSYQNGTNGVLTNGSMVNVGDYNVVVTGMGNYKDTVYTVFNITKASIGGGEGSGGTDPDEPTQPGDGFTVNVYPATGAFDNTDHAATNKFAVVVTHNGLVLEEDEDYTVSYRLNGSVITEVKSAGTYTVVVTGNGNYDGSTSATYVITPASSGGSDLEVSVDYGSSGGTGDSFTYDGTVKTPTITVQDADGEELTQGADQNAQDADYYVEFLGNRIDAGTYTFLIHGLGNYDGQTTSGTFSISPKSITDVTVNDIEDKTYTGQQIRPVPGTDFTVTDTAITVGDRQNLAVNVDYTVTYGPNVDVDSAGNQDGSVILHGTGNYEGTKTVHFDIVAADIGGGDGGDGGDTDPSQPGTGFTVDVYPASAPYTGKAHTPVVVVHYNGQLLQEGTDYDVSYRNDAGAVNADQLVDAGAYTIVVTGKGNYQGTVEKTYTITNAAGDVVLEIEAIDSQTYTGSQLTPTVVVNAITDNGVTSTPLTQDTHYTVSYSGSRVDAGVVIVTVTGTASPYTGLTTTAAFVIEPKDLSDTNTVEAEVTETDLVYDGTAKTPGVSVTYTPDSGTAQNLNGDDYILVYTNNINAGTNTASVTIHGRGNYTGTREVQFSIDKSGQAEDPTNPGQPGQAGFEIRVNPSSGPYTGVKHNPTVLVVDSATNRILKESEYTLTYSGDMTAVGSYTITAEAAADSNYQGQAIGTYEITRASTSGAGLTVQLANPGTFEYNGQEHRPAVTVTFNGNSVADTEYDVDYTGNINAGTATITVTGTGTSYAGLTGTAEFTITQRNISNADVGPIQDQTYTGGQITPPVTVTDSVPSADTGLMQGVDYTLEYGDNVNVDTGGTVTLHGTGNYTGTKEVSFNIVAAGIGGGTDPAQGFTVAVYPSTGVYSGAAHEPDVVVTYNGRVLTETMDYTVAYSGANITGDQMIEVGAYIITVTGRGNYQGSAQASYEITNVPDSTGFLNVTVTQQNRVYTGSAIELGAGDLTVTYQSNASAQAETLTFGDDYTVEYNGTNVNAGVATVIIKGAVGTSYENMTATTTFVISPKDIANVTVSEISAQTYTGQQIQPTGFTVTDTDRNAALNLNVDYTVSYGDNVDEGTDAGSVTITGTGNYQGTKTVNFDITKADIGGVDPDPSQPAQGFTVDVYPASGPYTGVAHTPVVVVHHNGQLLEKDTDYTVTYRNADNTADAELIQVGEYTIVVTGQGNYQGTVQASYEITDNSNNPVIYVSDITQEMPFTGSPVTPTTLEVTYRDAAGATTVLGEDDYTVTYSTDYTNVGLVMVTVTGMGTYSGLSATAAFQITRKDVADLTVEGIADQTYTGQPIEQDNLSITYNGNPLVEGTDYYVTYENNVNAGEATLTIHGMGNYTGVNEQMFTINKSGTTTDPDDPSQPGQAGFEVRVYPGSAPFTGGAHNPTILVVDSQTGAILNPDQYTLSGHTGMVDAKTYTITATATLDSNYVGQATGTYEITSPDAGGSLTVTATGGPWTYTGSKIEPTVEVSYRGQTLTQAPNNSSTDTTGDYWVEYQDNVAAGTYTITIHGMGANYGTLTGSTTFTIDPKDIASSDIDVSGYAPSYPYNGTAHRPTVTVTDGGRASGEQELQQDADYTVEYGINTDVGTGTIIIRGTGNYTGARTETFQIVTADSITVDPIPNQTYTGRPITPNVVVKDSNGQVLTLDTDYTVTYSPNPPVNVGTVTVTVTGIGNYAGLEAEQTFDIVAELLHLDVTVDPAQAEVNAGDPTFTVMLDGQELTEGDNGYQLTYQKYNDQGQLVEANEADLANAGMYVITASGTGDHAGAIGSTTFVRLPENLGEGGLDLEGGGLPTDPSDPNYGNNLIERTYDGSNFKSVLDGITVSGADGQIAASGYSVTVSYNGGTPANVTDSTQMVDAGYYLVTYTASGNVSGTATLVVLIHPRDISASNAAISVSGLDSQEYDSSVKTVTVGVTDNGLQGGALPTLTENTDFTVSGHTNHEDAGTYPVIITGIGNYTGVRVENFIITQKALTVKGDALEMIFGDPSPLDSLTEGNGYTLEGKVNGDDVDVVLSAPNVAGTYVIAATPSGADANNYDVTVDPNFTITVNPFNPIDPDGDGKPGVDTDGDGNSDPDPDNGDNDGDGVIDPDKDTDGDGNVEDENGDGVIETVTGFKVNMVPVYGYYNGQPHTPTITVTYTNGDGTITTLTLGQDYTVTYLDSNGDSVDEMTDVGVYTVRVTLQGNYTGGFDLTYTIRNVPGGGIITPPEPEEPGVADPDDTGVSDWLITDQHIAYLRGYGDLFAPNANMTRAEVAQMFYNLLRNKDVAITVSFSDVPAGSWYADAVNTLASLGIIKGAGDGKFYPNSPITRAEFTAIAMRFTNGGEITGEVSFTDVSPESWYYESVVGAVQYGWIIGYGNGLFAPNASITRAEVTTIANRMLGREADQAYVNSHLSELKQFSDVVGWSYYQIMEAVNGHGFTHTNGDEVWTGVN